MSLFSPEKRRSFVSVFAVGVAVVSVLVVFGFVALQAYVRWGVNRDFTFLGGNVLEALTVSAFGLVLGLAYLYRPVRHD